MDEVKHYAGAFRTALETRLQMRAQEERTDQQRLRSKSRLIDFWQDCFPRNRRERIRGSSREHPKVEAVTLSMLAWTGEDSRAFHVDVGIGDEVLEPIDVVDGRDWLEFSGIAPPSFPVISQEQQFAEKVHAYSLPRGDRVNTRTKDLIDMLLLIRQGKLDNPRLAFERMQFKPRRSCNLQLIRVAFVRRGTRNARSCLRWCKGSQVGEACCSREKN